LTCAHAGSPGTASGGPPTVPAGAPKVGSEQTKTDLDTAMHGEATAYAKCTLWGEHAAKEGSADVGRLFTGTAGVERQEHFAERAGLAESSAPVVSLAAAALLAGVARLDRPTALLGMIAGGSAAAVACAEDVRADARLVAIMQYLRVALIAATAPVLAGWLLASPTPSGDSHPANPPAWHLVTGPNQGAGLVLVAVVAFAGTVAAGRLRLPSAALLGPMLLAATLTMTGTTAGFAPSGALRSALLTVIGLDVGLRFTRSALTRLGRLLPLALACSVAISIACAMLAWSLSKLVHIPLTDAYLATTPGGINAVIATAAASHADVPLISSVQSIRLFCMVLLAPLLIRLAARWQDRPDERGHD
jgi:membrane AbrB-like protein